MRAGKRKALVMGAAGFLFLLGGLGAGSWAGLRAQEPVEDSETSAQKLLELIQALEEQESPPSVLGDLDLRRASSEVKKIARVLRETRVDLALEKVDLPAAIGLLRELSGLNFIISARARKAIDSGKPEVTVALRGLSLEKVLNLLAIQLEEYRFAIRHGAIFLLTKEEFRPPKTLRFYEVTDLVRPRPDFVAPPLALGSNDNNK